jgi:TonB-linked SusC/RagA family outer membrane protein
MVGYVSKEHILSTSQTVINITLESSDTDLEEVVVVGYGTLRKEAVTGSVASVKGDVLREIPTGNISRALQGRVAGVEMSQTNSKPGSTMQIRIRGTRSLNASNDPLVVLDGIPYAGSFSDIDPNSIESMDILKDASATAIYGSRGANGVLLITSKKGVSGQPVRVNYNGFHGIQTVFAKFPMMDGPEFVKLRKDAGIFQNTLDEADDVNTDWQDLLYRNGSLISHDVGINGGSQTGSYNFGMGYLKEEGVIPLQNFQRYSIRGAIDQKIGKHVRIGFNSNSNFSDNKFSNLGPGVIFRSPIANPYNEDGSLKRTILEQTSGAQFVLTRSVLEGLGDSHIQTDKAYGTYNTVFTEVKIPGIDGLKYRANLGLSLRHTNFGNFTGEGVMSAVPTNPSNARVINSLTTNWAIENLLTYDKVFAQKHSINAVALYSVQENKFKRSNIFARDIPANHFQFYNLGQAAGEIIVAPGDQQYNLSGIISYMGRVIYSYDDKYMLSATYRTDGSSRLAAGHKWHSYPAVSVGWNLHKESFMENVSSINSLKLRVGYGQTANQSINPYSTLGLLATRPYNFGDAYDVGYYVSELPNPNLGWEYSETTNFGLDFSLLKNRLWGTFEAYITNTKDVLLRVGLPSTSGVGSYMANIGATQNKGVELTLNGSIIEDRNGWSWDAGINLYSNRNRLVSLASGQTRDEGNLWFVGYPIDVIFDYKRIGLWQEGDPYLNVLEPGGNVGMIKVEYKGDYNADGTPVRAIGADDRHVFNINPKFQGGFNTRVGYKGFDLSLVGVFRSGGSLISTIHGGSGYLNSLNTRAGGNVKADYWTPENTDARYPKPGGIGTDGPKYGSTLAYFDASYVKLRTITLAYNLNSEFSKRLGVQNLRLYTTVNNPFVIYSPYHKETGMDPEPNSYGDQNVAVGGNRRLLQVGTNAPTIRSYVFGVNLTF